MSSNYIRFFHLLKRRPHYRRLVLSSIVSQLGDWLSYIALSFVAIKSSSGQVQGVGLAIAGVYLAHSLPNAIAAPIVGPIVDRFSRRRLMIISYLGAALVTLIISSQIASGSLLLLQGLICVRVMISNLGMNARQAALPTLVKADEIYTANALNSAVWSTLFTLGVALGGILATYLGPQQAILLDALTYVMGAMVAFSLPSLSPKDPIGAYVTLEGKIDDRSGKDSSEESSEESSKESSEKSPEDAPVKPKLREAWNHVKRHPRLWVPLFAKCPITIFNGFGWVALNILAIQRFPDLGAMAIGSLTAVRGVGMGVGPALLSVERSSMSPLKVQWLVIGALLCFILFDEVWLSLLAIFLWGVGNGVNWVLSTATLQSLTPPRMLGRITSIDFICFTLCQSIATLSAGALFDSGMSLPTVMSSVGAVGLTMLLILMWVERRIKQRANPSVASRRG